MSLQQRTGSSSSLSPQNEGDAAVEQVLAVPTRAGIYRRLRAEGQPVSARDAAEMFGLHPNVARNHLDVLAEAGLVVTGTRKHPGGGRPARVYVAREQATTGVQPQIPTGSQLAVHTIVQLIAGLTEHREKLALLSGATSDEDDGDTFGEDAVGSGQGCAPPKAGAQRGEWVQSAVTSVTAARAEASSTMPLSSA